MTPIDLIEKTTITQPGVKLLGITGPAHTGKDTVALIWSELFADCFHMGFANPLKQAAAQKFGVTINHFHDPELKGKIDPFWGISYRSMVQWEGTEATRNTAHHILGEGAGDAFWILRQVKDINEYVGYKNSWVLIPDLRFQNEYDYIVRNGGNVIDLTGSPVRGDSISVGMANHASEKFGLNLHAERQTYKILNDGTHDQLVSKVRELANRIA